jgi:pimeloyl-ACP methyl ester carboxylesterase
MLAFTILHHMKKVILLLLLPCLTMMFKPSANAQAPIPYGDHKAVGKYITLNGVKHYYEAYGEGPPLLLIHGNSTGISGWRAQIDFFSKKYTVYAIDCRGRGKSELGKDSLTYLQQAKDMAAFIKQLNLDSVSVMGKSDGGIIALMIGIYYPEHLSKIVSFSANVFPDTMALYPTVVEEIHQERVHAERMLAAKDTSQNWYLIQQRNRMMEFQPHLTAADLERIQIPTLVISCDRDLIKEEHTFFIYKNIPNAHLAIISGETHSVPRRNPTVFNTTVDKFLSEPFKDNSFRYSK